MFKHLCVLRSSGVSGWYRQLWSIGLGLVLCLSLTTGSVLAQQISPRVWDPAQADAQYDARKQQLITGPVNPDAQNRLAPRAAPACFEARDETWTQLPRNDDGSFGPVALGFDFSLFGTVYNSAYINTNGNLTFNAPLGTFTPSGFPINTPMVAAFWADVDTRNPASGAIYYKLFPDRLVVTYDRVGYYNQQIDKLSTFQLTIKANTVSGFTGNDVIFAYDDMQWTTGSASGGINGFGGAPATVGANRGNNVDFIQTGRFNINGNQPPNVPNPGDPGGVDFLDGQCIGYIVGGGSGNVPPAVAGLPSGNAITLDQGQTATVSLQFSGPETNQNVNVTANLNGLCNASATVSNNDTPNPTVTFTATGATCNIGTTIVTFTAVDNGSPSASQSFTIAVTVNPATTGPNTPPTAGSISNQTATVGQGFSFTIPPGTFTDAETPNSLTLTASGLPPGLSYAGGIITGTPSTTGVFTVTVTATDPGGLSVSTSFTITVNPGAVSPPGSFTMVAPTYNCLTGQITYNTINGDGTSITFFAIGINGPTVAPGPNYTDDVDTQLADDIRNQRPNVQPLTLYATQSGVTVTYVWNALAACGGTTPPPTPTPTGCNSPTATFGQPLALQPPSYTCSTGEIQFNTTGGNGSPITYFAIGIVSSTTNCRDQLDTQVAQDVFNDRPNVEPFLLFATQNGVTATYTFDARAYCRTTSARRGAEPGEAFGVSVLSNPVWGDAVEFEVRGAAGQPLRATIVDGQGRTISSQSVEQAVTKERRSLRLGRQPGMYLLQISTPTRAQTVKVIKH